MGDERRKENITVQRSSCYLLYLTNIPVFEALQSSQDFFFLLCKSFTAFDQTCWSKLDGISWAAN